MFQDDTLYKLTYLLTYLFVKGQSNHKTTIGVVSVTFSCSYRRQKRQLPENAAAVEAAKARLVIDQLIGCDFLHLVDALPALETRAIVLYNHKAQHYIHNSYIHDVHYHHHKHF